MKIAVIKTGGKQYIAKEGDFLTVEKFGRDLKKGDEVTFDTVLMIDDGTTTRVGTPTVADTVVRGEVVAVGKGEKKVVFRYKAKSNRRKLKGHRQPFVKVKITTV
jgi:large subunit ribosomal protein L21